MSKPISVFITNVAKEDIAVITDYIALDNKFAAIKVVEMFYGVFELLRYYPETGVIKEGIVDKSIRIYIAKKRFFIVYRITDNKIEILRILTKYQNIFAVLN